MLLNKFKKLNFFIKIAYRNIYRNVRRSIFCIAAVAIAVFFIIMMMSYVQGLLSSVKTIVTTFDTADIKITTKEFEVKKEFLPLQYPIIPGDGGLDNFLNELRSIKGVKTVLPRITAAGSLLDNNVKHAVIWGINIDEENKTNHFNIKNKNSGLILGRFPETGKSECAIGIRMARKLQIIQPVIKSEDYRNIYQVCSSDEKSLLDRYYLPAQYGKVYLLKKEKADPVKPGFAGSLKKVKGIKLKKSRYKEINKKDELALLRIFVGKKDFRIVIKIVSSTYSDKFFDPVLTGIFDFDYAEIDQNYIIMPYDKLSRIAVLKDKAQAVFIYLNDPLQAGAIAAMVRSKLKENDLVIKEWEKHDFIMLFKKVQYIYYFMYLIFIVIASFLIVNTIVMIINERIKEIGMMGALGMSRFEILAVFFMEAVILSLFGAFSGTLIGGVLTYILSSRPINMEALIGSIDYPTGNTIFIKFSYAILLTGFLFGTILSSLCTIIPSLKSAFISPVEALRK